MKHTISAVCLVAFIVLLSSGCSKKPGSIIKNFAESKSWEEKKEYVLDATGLKEESYFLFSRSMKIDEISFQRKLNDSTSVFKVTSKDVSGTGYRKEFIIVNTKEGEKIDLKSMMHENSMNFIQFINTRPKEPIRFWVYPTIFGNRPDQKIISLKPGLKYEGLFNELFILIVDDKFSEDEKKIWDHIIKNTKTPVLIEAVSNNLVQNRNGESFLLDVKFIKEYPLQFDFVSTM
ncbi:MAG: hypothetical protein LWX70_09005 [Sphingobacteriia bacterium]|nr:hypothetical protein [Sphingobacteriia bacterium]